MMKIIYLFLLILLSACNSNVPLNDSATKVDYEEFFQTFFGHFNNHDWEQMANMYTQVAEFKDPALGIGAFERTRAATIAQYTTLSQMIPDVRDSVVQIYPSSNKNVIVEFISMGTAPDGTAFTLPLCAIMKIENGLITRDYVYYDNF
ncbi:MAG: nuclear transport factor 2 family protein [Bacteroidota bacterium]